MGLLDEAIREHLELKRRRGADSAEITRQEQEAFGPARRGDLEAVHVAPDNGRGHEDAEPALDAPAEFAADEAPTRLHAVDEGPILDEPPHIHTDDEPPTVSDPPRPHGDPADHLPHAEPHVEPHIEPAPVQERRVVPPAAAPASQPTRAFDADEVREASGLEAEAEAPVAPERPDEGTGEEGDVLEETPEFLQETPEHDRLWFEQRPPRDFDF